MTTARIMLDEHGFLAWESDASVTKAQRSLQVLSIRELLQAQTGSFYQRWGGSRHFLDLCISSFFIQQLFCSSIQNPKNHSNSDLQQIVFRQKNNRKPQNVF